MQRRAEFDALRGLFLVLMALTHLPTRLNGWFDQPLGFVSTAEGFVLISAFIAGSAYTPLMLERGLAYVKQKLWRRAFKLYRLHIVLLLFAVATAAIVVAASGRPGLRNLLSFYFDSPGWAAVTGPLLLYQPPLLDVLPMYIAFLALTPFVLQASRTLGWSNLMGLSFALWVFAQCGGEARLHAVVFGSAGLPVPKEARGAFDWLAWQFVWVGGLCLGSLRVINFIALLIVGQRLVLPLLASLRLGFLRLLGRGSLEAFAAHVVVCILSLSLVIDEQTPLSAVQQIAVVLITFAAMWLAAWISPPRPPIDRGALQ